MEKNILIICETGISAALLVSKMLEVVRAHELDYDIDYAPYGRLQEKIDFKNYDDFLLTPQVARYQEKIAEALKPEAGKIHIIQPEDFQYMNVEKIVHQLTKV